MRVNDSVSNLSMVQKRFVPDELLPLRLLRQPPLALRLALWGTAPANNPTFAAIAGSLPVVALQVSASSCAAPPRLAPGPAPAHYIAASTPLEHSRDLAPAEEVRLLFFGRGSLSQHRADYYNCLSSVVFASLLSNVQPTLCCLHPRRIAAEVVH